MSAIGLIFTLLLLSSLLVFLVPQLFGGSSISEIEDSVLRRVVLVLGVPGALTFLIFATLFDLGYVAIVNRSALKSELYSVPGTFEGFTKEVVNAWVGL